MKSVNGVSPAIIIAIIWMLRISSRGIMYWINPGAGLEQDIDSLQGSPVDRTFLSILELLGIAVLFYRQIDWGLFARKNYILLILYLYMGLSILWSEFPGVSFRRWIRTIGDLIMVIVLISDKNFVSAFVRTFRAWAYILIPLSFIFVKYFRQFGVSYDYSGDMEMWIGVTTHKNSLGQLVCLCTLFFIWVFTSRQYRAFIFDIPIFLMALWLLNGSTSATSRTSLSIFLIGAITIMILNLLSKNRVALIKYSAIVLVGTFLIGIVLTPYLYSYQFIPFVIAKTGGDPTLTGRTYLWDALIEIGKQNALFGVGYGGFWIGEHANNLWKTFSWHPGQAHNGYIDVYIDIGIIGILLLSLAIISTFNSILASIKAGSDYAKFRLLMLITILIYNFTESSFIKPTSLLWFLLLLIAIQIPETLPEKNRRCIA